MATTTSTTEIDVKSLIDNATEDFSSIVVVNATSYNVYDHWLRLATKYFNIDTNSDYYTSTDSQSLNLLKAGLFGYFNEIASHEIKNAVFHRNVLYDEHFLNSASFPESIYNFAKLYNVPISTSHPAHMLVELVVKKDDLLNSSLKQELVPDQVIDINTLKTYKLILSKEYEFSVDKFKFLLPYDVEILMKQTSNKEFTITASYILDDNNFPYLEEITSPYVKTYQEIVNGETYVFFALDLYQMERNTETFEILSEDISDNLFYTTTYKNQLAYFNVYYTYKGETFLLNQYFNNTYTPSDSEEKYCYYTFLDNDKLQVSFSSLPNSFRPRYNSSITIECMTTLGEEGNFSYKGEISFSFGTDSTTNFSKLASTVVPITDSSNGSNKLSTTGMKQRIIQEALTRDNLITDSDLEIFFTNVNNNNSVNESYVKFFKKQDDFLKRIYNSFLLMREKEKKVIPTNTATYVKFKDTDPRIINATEDKAIAIPEHSLIKCDYSDKDKGVKFEFIGNVLTEEIRKAIVDKNDDKDTNIIYYLCPFLLKVNMNPVISCEYFELDLNGTFNMSYAYLNNLVPSSLIINKININKENNYTVVDSTDGNVYPILEKEIKDIEETINGKKVITKGSVALSSDTYKISFELNSNQTIDELDSKIKIRGKLISSKTGKDYGYFEFNRFKDENEDSSSSQSLYQGYISTNRQFDDEDRLCIFNSLYDNNGNVINKVFIDEDIILKIGILYKDTNLTKYNDDITEFNLFNDQFPRHKTDENISDYTLASSLDSSTSINFYKNISNVMSSVTTFIEEESDDYGRIYKTELIPLIDSEYFLYNHEEIYSILKSYIDIMESCLPRLENNTNIDLKFYNSYGPSMNYYIDKEVKNEETGIIQTESKRLSRVDILLDFDITLYQAIDDEMDNSIKKFISDFVEASNVDGIIPISNLIRLLEVTFPVIKYIEYNGLSGEYDDALNNKYQKIEDRRQNFLNMSKQEIIEYVPEYVNIKKGLKNYSVVQDSLNKKYDYIINITYK